MMKKRFLMFALTAYSLCLPFLAGCQGSEASPPVSESPAPPVQTAAPDLPGDTLPSGTVSPEATEQPAQTEAAIPDSSTPTSETALRDNTPVCLVPTADQTAETHNDAAAIDYSHAADGYIMARYFGSSPKVKMQIKGPDQVTYTYNLISSDFVAFPLSAGDGSYDVAIYENISGTSYLTCLTTQISVTLTSEFGPYLYPNQYCSFSADSETVAKASELAKGAACDLDVVSAVYNYIISSITYDYDKASTVPSGYTADVDEILEKGTGICLDYAAVMTSMLRSQRIPTRLEVGYAGDAYHAWISTYITDIGWVNGIVEFDGKSWELMDPTFAASNSEKELRKFIGDGSNYVVKYMY